MREAVLDLSDMPTTPTSIRIAWGKNVQSARRDAALTQLALANRLGVSQYTISKLEHGRRPSDEMRLALADIFDTTVEALFPYSGIDADADADNKKQTK